MDEEKQEESQFWVKNRQTRKIEDEYILGDIIGRGATSTVYKCLRKGRTEWACKVFQKSHLNRKFVETEIDILLKLRHPTIVQIKEVFETEHEIQMILELVNGGELFERIVERGQYSEKDAAGAVRQILSALEYLHKNGVIHRDIKPENLLYATEEDDSRLKLADFGLSKILSDSNMTMNTVCGTVGYCAPEILLHKTYDWSIDMWSLGVVTYIMLCGFEPFWDDGGEFAVCKRIVKGDYTFQSPWWDDISDSAKDLITQLLSLDPKSRPTATQALNHPWTCGQNTPSDNMHKTIKKLREFNARRKFRVATAAVIATHRAFQLISPDRLESIYDKFATPSESSAAQRVKSEPTREVVPSNDTHDAATQDFSTQFNNISLDGRPSPNLRLQLKSSTDPRADVTSENVSKDVNKFSPINSHKAKFVGLG